MSPVITIDGPAASGKSSVSRRLAERLGWNWVSTGAFYRAIALIAQQKGADFNNESQISSLISLPHWEVRMTPEITEVWYAEKNVTPLAFSETIGTLASRMSKFPKVRKMLLKAQRRCAEKGIGLIAEGRDCGTIVFPHAILKIYLTADPSQRALRRLEQEGGKLEEIKKSQQIRDINDSSRTHSPLQIPPDGILIDTSCMDLSGVVDEIEKLAKEKISKASKL